MAVTSSARLLDPLWLFTRQWQLGEFQAEDVGTHWIPLLPVQQGAADSRTTRLRRGALLAADGSNLVRASRGDASNAGQSPSLFEEEVPREGVRLTRRRRLARWIDGSTWLWTALRREIGRGEASSGLAFDTLEEHQP